MEFKDYLANNEEIVNHKEQYDEAQDWYEERCCSLEREAIDYMFVLIFGKSFKALCHDFPNQKFKE